MLANTLLQQRLESFKKITISLHVRIDMNTTPGNTHDLPFLPYITNAHKFLENVPFLIKSQLIDKANTHRTYYIFNNARKSA